MSFSFRKSMQVLFSVLFVCMLLLTSCSKNKPTSSDQSVEPTATVTPTPEPKSRLTVCLGEEPKSLYFYANASQAMWSVLEAIYDGPIDTVNYQPVPVILTELPSQANGGITLQEVSVSRGDKVANTTGDVVSLQKGVRVFPAGCTSETCAVEWDGAAEISVVQMSVIFHLLPGVKWSDGQPLTAADSVYSFQLSADPDTKVTKTAIDRTAEYIAMDEQTVKWTGVAGFITTRPSGNFWLPQPKHLLEGHSALELNTAAITNQTPLGWGAYQIAEWLPGSEIRLVKNPNYFRASEGLPRFDEVVYRFLPTSAYADLSPLVTGECDIMDSSNGLEDQIQDIRELELGGQLKSYFGQGPAWTGINFGIKPATYDDGYNPFNERSDFFGDARTRQAFAACIDREKIITELLFSQSAIPPTYLPVGNPLAASGLPVFEHNPDKGIQLLEEVGWKDWDADPATPRTSSGVANVLGDTPFSVKLAMADTELNRQVAAVVVNSLQECGLEVIPDFIQPAQLLAGGPDGVVFGRNFDLAQLTWSTGMTPSCFLYSTSEIPAATNSWLGTKYGGVNVTGYSNPDYDNACSGMLSAGLDDTFFTQYNISTQSILANDLPVVPLYYQIKAMISRPDLCGLSLDTSARSPLGGIESLELSQACP